MNLMAKYCAVHGIDCEPNKFNPLIMKNEKEREQFQYVLFL